MHYDEDFESLDHFLDLLRAAVEQHGPALRMSVQFRSKHGDPGPTQQVLVDLLPWDVEECLRLARRYQALVATARDVVGGSAGR